MTKNRQEVKTTKAAALTRRSMDNFGGVRVKLERPSCSTRNTLVETGICEMEMAGSAPCSSTIPPQRP